jgi:hypothetical protein
MYNQNSNPDSSKVLHASNKRISTKEINSFSEASNNATQRRTGPLPKVDDESVKSGLTPA